MKIEKFEYDSYNSINDKLFFNMDRKDVRKIYSEFKEFKKNIYEFNTTDHYEDCNIYYDENDKLEFLETAPGVSVKFNGCEISKGKTFKETKKILLGMDGTIVEDEVGLVSYKLGLGIYIDKEMNNSNNEELISVYFFRKGYYD